jgi:hypothetical protein
VNKKLLNWRVDPMNGSVRCDPSPEAAELTLAPVEFDMPGFERRIAPVTEAELRSMDLVRHIAATQSEVAS